MPQSANWLQALVADFGRKCAQQLQGGVGEPEAALRPAIESLLAASAVHLGHNLVVHGEVPLHHLGVRPDFALRVDGIVTGYLEIKAPETNLEPSSFRGHNRTQWDQLRDLPDLIYTNGTEWRLYQSGELKLRARLTGNLRTSGDKLALEDDEFELLLRKFLQWSPQPIDSVTDLVRDIAPLCRLLRSSVLDRLAVETKAIRDGADPHDQPFTGLVMDWRNLLFPTASDKTFADGYAQTLTFALLLARTEGVDFGPSTTIQNLVTALQVDKSYALMAKALQLLTESATEQLQVTLDLLMRTVGAVRWDHIRDTNNLAYLHLYESFLEVYDRKLREDSGVYYTPFQVVDAMVRLTGEVLRSRLGIADGFLAPNVVTVDPAMGTGTFLNSILETTARQAAELYGPGAVAQAITGLAQRLIGFELQMGAYAVAEMRVADLLKTYGAYSPSDGMRLYVTNTLDDPFIEETHIASTYEPIAKSQRQANKVKANTPVTVVIGNPPYDEHAQNKGSWVERGGHGSNPPLNLFRQPGKGRLEYVLKSFYVYFYAWAMWKVFEAHSEHKRGVVTYITTSGYLTGAGFAGMRRYLRQTCSEGWIINVTPEGMRPDPSTRIFEGVQQPLAIGIFVRRPDSNSSVPAVIHYTEITGKRKVKFAKLAEIGLDDPGWQEVRSEWEAPFTPAAKSQWDSYLGLSDILPWVAPGIKPNRTWVYAPSAALLKQRWNRLIGEKDKARKLELFKESSDRNLDTISGPLPGYPDTKKPIGAESGPCPEPRRVAFRSFDRKWIIPDKRLIHRPSDDLWRAADLHGQVFLVEQHAHSIRSGPGVVFTTLIPDMHYFNARGGRVLPLFHPDSSPNISPNLLSRLSARLNRDLSALDLAAYIAGIAAHPGFTERFSDELTTPGIRIPFTADGGLFEEVAEVGRDVIWAGTFGMAAADGSTRPEGKITFGHGDPRQVQNLTSVGTSMPESISYNASTQEILTGHGSFGPVPERVWNYDVGGMGIVTHWFDYRKSNPIGKKTSDLDSINAQAWPFEWITEFIEVLSALRRLTDLESAQVALLENVLSGPRISKPELASEGVAFPQTDKDRRPHLPPDGDMLY